MKKRYDPTLCGMCHEAPQTQGGLCDLCLKKSLQEMYGFGDEQDEDVAGKQRSYNQICVEYKRFEKEFIPSNNLHLSRLFELCFFVGAASSMAEPDDDLMMRITTTLSLIDYDQQQYMKKNWEKL